MRKSLYEVALSFILVLMAGLFFVHVPLAAASCSSTQQDMGNTYTLSSDGYGSTDTESIVFTSLCGSGLSNGGYESGYTVTFLSATCGFGASTDVEAGMFYGTMPYGSNPSSGSDLNYYYIVSSDSILGTCTNSVSDVTNGGSYYPAFGDNVSLVEIASPTATAYDVEYSDNNNAKSIQVDGITTSGKSSILTEIQLETYNPNNQAVVEWGDVKYITSAYGTAYIGSTTASNSETHYTMSQPNSFAADYCGYYDGPDGDYSSICTAW